jgi:beta-lactamase regulating signal transducer with metallopeptidase domain
MSSFPMVFSLFAQLFHQLFHCCQFWAPVDAFRNYAHLAAPLAVTALWQGAIVAAGLAIALRFAQRASAAHRFATWAAGFGVLVALPFAPAIAHTFSGRLWTSGVGTVGTAALPVTAHPLIALNDGWSLAIAALWMLVALARALDLAIHVVRLRRLWKSAMPVAPAVLNLGAEIRLRGLEICTTRELDRPSVIGFFRPRILIPDWLLEKLSPQELEQVVLHEAEHLRRRDDWTNLLQKLCLVVFPLNPALAFVERRMCREREMACDEGVVRRTQAPRAYAACLAGLAEHGIERRAEALSLGAFGRRPELVRRVQSILSRRSAMNPLASRAMIGVLGSAMAIGAVMMARCPQLVAFVPAQARPAAAGAQMATADMVTDPHLAQAGRALNGAGFRSLNAMAIMPQTVRQRVEANRHEASKAASKTSCPYASGTSFLRSAINAAQSIKSDTAAVQTAARNGGAEVSAPREVIVFTAYEQVNGADGELGDKVVSDYEAGRQPLSKSAGGFAVTQLIFHVDPADNASQADGVATAPVKQADASAGTAIDQTAAQSKSTATGKAAEQTAQPGTIPSINLPQGSHPKAISLGNGWLVIQL